MTIEFNGYHGTNLKSAKQIVSSSYESSTGDDEWLGFGVYFFVKGISSKPEEQAKKWSISHSWDNVSKNYKYKQYCTINSRIKVENDNFLDLTEEDGVDLLGYFYECFEKKIKKTSKRFDYIDGLLINLARGEGIMPIDVVKGNFYIKFAKERIKNINLRTSNCTICTVFEPNKNIVDTKIVNIGDIKDETN